jgi:ketosteroid isomerase-like protein
MTALVTLAQLFLISTISLLLEDTVRISYVLCFLMAAFSVPALAADADPKQEVEKVVSAYVESFNKQDAVGIAARYANGGVLVNAAGPHADIPEFYKNLFKTGFDHDDVTVDQVSPLGADAALGIGTFRISGKNQSGEPIEFVGRWTAVYIREGGGLKIRMISAFPKAAPPKD